MFGIVLIGPRFEPTTKEEDFENDSTDAGSLDKEMVLEWGEMASEFDLNCYREEFLELVSDWNE